MKEEIIKFLRKKDYKWIREIGQGGTGKTVLLEDETINEKFVCKKYSPFYEQHQETYFSNFVAEIKLLHLLHHKNVVRVFNYYLYPERTTGYILMEFISGSDISTYVKNNPEKLNDIFIQTISGFRHLEENNILHRDIRPENIMVSENEVVKIIDFGFGKKVEFSSPDINSISLNWRYTIPQDFEHRIYDFRTEVYFLGKLFEEIIHENHIEDFSFLNVINLMANFKQENRIASFFEVDRKIIEGGDIGISFSYEEKDIYKKFANELTLLFSQIERDAKYVKEIDTIITSLTECYNNSTLEDFVQNPSSVAQCFVRGAFFYSKSAVIQVFNLKNMLKLLKFASIDRKRVIINNLWQRLDSIKRYTAPQDDDLPF